MRIFLLIFIPIVLFASYADRLKTKAIELNLYETPKWHAIVGYKPSFFGGVESEIDDPMFFLAKDGATDPQAEALATIDSFVSGEYDHNRSMDSRCIFVARYKFLKRALSIDEKLLKPKNCEAFDHWYGGVSGDRLILEFPAAYMNNPASMFGHTFLRVDKNETVNPLTSYAINYAAATPSDENAIIFTFKGLFGFYPGYFSALPFAEKAKEYGDMESRDIWEYELNFTREEIDDALLRAWELHYFYRDYAFLKENCSFVLLELLERSKGLDLSDDFHLFAAPIDTVRAIVTQPNMLLSAKFRPSRSSIIANLSQNASDESLETAIALTRGEISASDAAAKLAKDDAIDAIELAMEYANHLYGEDKIDSKSYKTRYFDLMRSRSRLGKRESPRTPIAVPIRPDLGHLISRVAIGGGIDSEEKPSGNIRARVSYHDMVDPPAGFAIGTSVVASDLWLQYSDDAARIRRYTLLNIESFAVRSAFFSPISWRFALGWKDAPPSLPKNGRGFFNGGGGLSWGGESAIAYLTIDAEGEAGYELHDDRALYLGGSIGAIFLPSDRVAARIEAKQDYDLTYENKARTTAKIDASFAIAANVAARLEFAHEKLDKTELNEAFLFIDYFF